jgi:hypothetical protein
VALYAYCESWQGDAGIGSHRLEPAYPATSAHRLADAAAERLCRMQYPWPAGSVAPRESGLYPDSRPAWHLNLDRFTEGACRLSLVQPDLIGAVRR